MDPKLEEIRKKFSGKLVGNTKMQKLVCETLLVFPPKIIDYLTRNVWFISSLEDAWGFVFKGNDLKGKSAIFLSDKLFAQSKFDQRYEIVHEIGHIILKHRNAFSKPQTDEEVARQEKEADSFARHYLKF
jgi:hypothetical protein